MKTRIGSYWMSLFSVAILLGVADPAGASLKRVIILERADVGFPPLTDTSESHRVRLAERAKPSPREDTVERVKGEFSD